MRDWDQHQLPAHFTPQLCVLKGAYKCMPYLYLSGIIACQQLHCVPNDPDFPKTIISKSSSFANHRVFLHTACYLIFKFEQQSSAFPASQWWYAADGREGESLQYLKIQHRISGKKDDTKIITIFSHQQRLKTHFWIRWWKALAISIEYPSTVSEYQE